MISNQNLNLFDPHQIITSSSGSGNNWARGFYHHGPLFIDQILDSVRKEAEFCDSLQSFISIQSSGGGTGSGLGSFVQKALKDNFPKIYRFSNTIVPSANDDVITSPYNSLFSLHKLATCSDCVLPVDNQSLISIVNRISKAARVAPGSSIIDNNMKKLRASTFDSMNQIVANLMINMTSSVRFNGTMNVDINDIVTNLVPFPHLNMILSSMAPLFGLKDLKTNQSSIDQMFTDIQSPETQLLSVDPRQQTVLACAFIARGDIQLSDVQNNISRMKLKFPTWNQNACKTGFCDVPPFGQTRSLLMLSNNASISSVFAKITERFVKLYRRKAHMHHYLEFMEKSEFETALEFSSHLRQAYNKL